MNGAAPRQAAPRQAGPRRSLLDLPRRILRRAESTAVVWAATSVASWLMSAPTQAAGTFCLPGSAQESL